MLLSILWDTMQLIWVPPQTKYITWNIWLQGRVKIQKCYLTTAKDVVGVKCCTSLTSYTLPWTTCVIYITALQVLRGAVDSDVPLWPLGTMAYSQATHSWHPKAPSPNAPLIVLRGPAAPTLALCYLCSLFTAENTSASSIHLCLRLKIYFAHQKVSWLLYFFFLAKHCIALVLVGLQRERIW